MRSAILSCLLAGLATISAIPTVSVKGSKFFTSDGDQFFIKGSHSSQTQLFPANTVGLQELPINSSQMTLLSTTPNVSSMLP
jgi:hypothetical protein